MKNYFEESYQHYIDLKTKLEEATGDLSDKKNLGNAISKYHKDLNNLIMAGLGMGTLYLRMGAVLMIAEKTKPEAEKDVSFLKLIAEKLIHKLPTDGDWLEIWKNYLKNQTTSSWNQIVLENKDDIHSKFVSFRNDVAHQKIIINDSFSYDRIHEITDGLITLEAMSKFRQQFQDASISQINNEVFFQYEENSGEKFKISPYVQMNKNKEVEDVGVLPYLFQGNYYKGSKFINTEGAETKEEKDDTIDDAFDTIKKDIQQFNGDKAFDFNEKIKNYNEWCIGRDIEVEAILEWINKSDTDNNVLPIFAPAGLGKGALVSEVIKVIKEKVPVMFHFCGSGTTNNLQSVLYHLILQGKKMPGMNGAGVWRIEESVQKKLNRLPSQYVDTISFFQLLLKNNYLPIQKFNKKPLVVIIDGLDEAAVSDNSKKISDWFYTYDDKGERKEKWECPSHIKWIFTYRQTSKENKNGFQFEYHEFKTHDLPEMQPLKGLTKKAVIDGLKVHFKDFEPTLTEEFIESITTKGIVK
jgi:hypothetical protein